MNKKKLIYYLVTYLKINQIEKAEEFYQKNFLLQMKILKL